jgi:hypothetical protein
MPSEGLAAGDPRMDWPRLNVGPCLFLYACVASREARRSSLIVQTRVAMRIKPTTMKTTELPTIQTMFARWPVT